MSGHHDPEMTAATGRQSDAPGGTVGWPAALPALIVMSLAGLFAAWCALGGRPDTTYPLDVDGWGAMIARLKSEGHVFTALLRDPLLFRGPVVPFLFGLAYYVVPSDQSVLFFNAGAFGIAAGALWLAFRGLGINSWLTAAALGLWLAYEYSARTMFAYYFAEPTIAMFSSLFFLMVSRTLIDATWKSALASGLLAALLLLGRPTFALVVISVPMLLFRHLATRARPVVFAYSVAFAIAFGAWPLRNAVVHGAFIPFTTEGGLALFMGTYPKGDDSNVGEMRQIPEFAQLERVAKPMDQIAQDRYWKRLAVAQVLDHPVAQLSLLVRKTLRFWMYMSPNSWRPTFKTLLVFVTFVPLACIGAIRWRRLAVVQLCIVWTGGLWLFHALVHSELRYNFPIVPMMFMLSLLGMVSVCESLRPKWVDGTLARRTLAVGQ
jgi:hypothetical protein